MASERYDILTMTRALADQMTERGVEVGSFRFQLGTVSEIGYYFEGWTIKVTLAMPGCEPYDGPDEHTESISQHDARDIQGFVPPTPERSDG